jgi:NTE family protein
MDITLALGGGGVKGTAYTGIFRVLDREGFRIRAIAGTSAGGLWGAFYAAGYKPDEIERIMVAQNRTLLFKRLPGDGPSMYGLAGVKMMLESALGSYTFEQLKLPLAVTAVDLQTAERIVLSRGRVIDAIGDDRPPRIFPPKELEGRLLVDGGVLSPVPVSWRPWLRACRWWLSSFLHPSMAGRAD